MRTRRDAKRLVFLVLIVICLTVCSTMWLKLTPVRAQSSTADRLREARAALVQAQSKEKFLKTKKAGHTAEAILREYNAAVEARVAELFARVKVLSELMGENTTSPFDVRGEKGKAKEKGPDPALASEYEALQSELAAINPEPLSPGNINALMESEPNNTFATANPLGLDANNCRVATGAITAGDIDIWSFTAPAGSRVWAYVDTGGGQSSPANDRDTFLTLFNFSTLEEDDDDGTGNGCDSGTETGFSSTISGRSLALAGTYFLIVEGFDPSSVANPYRLFVVVTTGAGSAEVEPNNTAATANPGLVSGNVVVKTGSITPAGDADFFTIVANADDVFYISGDGNPERDATNTDLVLDITHPDGRTLMQPPADSGIGGSATNPEGESFCIATPMDGIYTVSVSGFGTSTGTYGLMVARCSAKSVCPVTMFTGVLGLNSTEYPGVSGTQNGRLNRFIDQTGACNNIRTCPGLFTIVGARPFDAYSFTNASANTVCVTVDVDAQACVGNNFLVVAAYLGSYNSGNQCLNYLADIGGSPNPVGSFSLNVQAGTIFTLVIIAANASPTVCTTPYKVTVVGLPTFSRTIRDDTTGNTLLFDPLTGNYKFTSCSTGMMVTGTGGAFMPPGCTLFFGGGGPSSTVSAMIDLCTGVGSATITIPSTPPPVSLSDSNVNNNTCFCP